MPRVVPWLNTTRGEYYARVVWGDGKHPLENRYPLGTDNADTAQKLCRGFAKERLPALAADREQDASPKLQDAVRWYVTIHAPFKGLAPKTISAYDRVLHDFLTFCRSRNVGRAQQLSTRIIQEWQIWQGKGVGPKRDELLILRHFFAEAVDAGELPELPKMKWNIPGKSRSQRFRALDSATYNRALELLHKDPPGRAYLPIYWSFLTPWLPSDTLDFRHGEDRGSYIDRDRIKTSRQMLFPITPEMRGVIDAATKGRELRRDSHVFLNKSAPWRYQDLEKQFRYWQKKHGLDFTFRDLRVTWASRLAATGCPAPHLAELMGHEDVTTTFQYYVEVEQAALEKWVCTMMAQTCTGTNVPPEKP